MKFAPAIWVFLLLAGTAAAQTRPAQTHDSVQNIQKWMQDNLDPDNYEFDGIDTGQVRSFFDNLTKFFNGTNLYDFGTLKVVAARVLPVLDEYEETEPYAIWLRAHMDDLDAAGEIQRELKPAKGSLTVQSMPTAKFERAFWNRRLEKRPLSPLVKKWVPPLKEVFREEKMPPELVWLAGVESSFDPRARSPAGAAGMFQLMPATAKDEHLSLWPFDQRYQPEKSAHAAAHYLRGLHAHYGDWPLTLAAYNVGEGRVDKLLKEHNASSFEGIHRWLPVETQMYVPKIEATIQQREGVSLENLHTPVD